MTVLSDNGNPWPAADAHDVFIARRQGNGTKSGAILVLNNNDTQAKGLWVDNAPVSGYDDWAGKTLVNVVDGTSTTQVYGDGRVWLSAPSRGYALWVPQDEYVAMSGPPSKGRGLGETPASFTVDQNYPNPFNPATTIAFTVPAEGPVTVNVYNMLGQQVAAVADEVLSAGSHRYAWEASAQASGVYYYTVSWNGQQQTRMMTLLK